MSVEPEGIQPRFLQMAYWVFNFFFGHNPGALQNAAHFLIIFYPSRSVFLGRLSVFLKLPHAIFSPLYVSHWFVCSPRTFPVSPLCSWPLTFSQCPAQVGTLYIFAACMHACVCEWTGRWVSRNVESKKSSGLFCYQVWPQSCWLYRPKPALNTGMRLAPKVGL